nr:pentatricopeptide repeat-containing protein [Quercus suber]
MFGDLIEMYSRMQMAGVSPDCFTFPYLLKACCGLLALEMGWQVHGQIFRHGFELDVFVQNSLVAMYAKCSQIRHARMVFDGLYDRTIVTWTSIISGYAQNGEPIEALRIFSQMRQSNVKPDWIALVSVLRAYTDVEDLEQGKSVHGCVIKMGLEYEPDLLISLTAMYAKCYAKNGYAEEAVGLFHEMIEGRLILHITKGANPQRKSAWLWGGVARCSSCRKGCCSIGGSLHEKSLFAIEFQDI